VEAVLQAGPGEDIAYPQDLLMVLQERADRLRETHIEGASDLAVEAVSPLTAHSHLFEKPYDYGQAGVQEHWVVDPETQMVEIYGLEEKGLALLEGVRGMGRVRSCLIPGLETDVAELFHDL
jgi:Uma2 family endonuclease